MAANSKILLLPLGIFLLGWIGPASGQHIVDAGSKRFVIFTQKLNWYRANFACIASGLTLAAIESDAEYKSLRSYIIDKDLFGTEFWLSGSNLDGTEYTWLSNGNTFSYTQWQNGKPGASPSPCVFADYKFQWDTAACADASKPYICSKPLVPNCGITGRCKRV